MALLTKKEMKHMPIVDDPNDATYGVIEIDLEKCEGCTMCTLICPGNVLEMFGEGRVKKARVRDAIPKCLACDNCHAICDAGAISLVSAYDFAGRYKQLDRGAIAKPRKF